MDRDAVRVWRPTLLAWNDVDAQGPGASVQGASYGQHPVTTYDTYVPSVDLETETKATIPPVLPAYDTGPLTGWGARIGLLATWVAGIVCIAGGATTFATPSVVEVDGPPSTFSAPLPPGFTVIGGGNEVWALLATALLTLITEATGFVHSVCLRWNLWREGRLTWTTSLRLITTSRTSVSTSLAANLLYFVTLGLAFTASSQIFVAALFYPGDTVMDQVYDGSSNGWTELLSLANGAALITLGVCLIVQAALVTWMYAASRHHIKTWSSSPLTIALACTASHAPDAPSEPTRYSTMTSVAMRLPQAPHYAAISGATALTPKRKQESLFSTRKRGTVAVLVGLVLLFALVLVWAGIVINAFAGAHVPISGAELDSDNAKIMQLADSVAQQQAPAIQMFAWQQNGSTGPPPMSTATTMFVCLLLVFILQALLTFALHSVELLCNTFRDQRRWQQAANHLRRRHWSFANGASLDANAILVFVTSAPNVLLLAGKVLAHWLFNRCLLPLLFFSGRVNFADNPNQWQTSETQIQLFGVPVLVLTAVVFVLSVLAFFLAFWRPRTPQPATYGHLPTQMDVVDDWGSGQVIFWGDKGMAEDGIHRHAGTAGRAADLGPVQYECQYL